MHYNGCMRMRLILLAIATSLLLAACGKPMENKDLADKNRDDTGKAMKQAGGDE